nr:DUF5720 family protein [Neglectibacter sp. X58]
MKSSAKKVELASVDDLFTTEESRADAGREKVVEIPLSERFQDKTRWMVEFSVLRPRTAYGAPGDETRLFLDEDGYQAVLASQKRRDIKIKRYARVIEGHILDFKPKKKRHP